MPNRLGEVIRARRIELGLTQEQLAERIGDGVRQAEISRLEGGRVEQPRRQRLEKIAVALGVPLGELLARSGWADDGSAVSRIPEARAQAAQLGEQREEVSTTPRLSPEIQRLRAAIERSRSLRARTSVLVEQASATWLPIFGYPRDRKIKTTADRGR